MKTSNYTAMAVQATVHCLIGCGIGEVLGMVIGTLLNFSNMLTIIISVGLAFIFGYALSLRSVLSNGIAMDQAWKIVLAADTLSITSMEIVDNTILVLIPGALDAMLTDILFWLSLIVSLAIAFVVTVPVNHWLIVRGKGHALVHDHHDHHHAHSHK